MTSYLIHVEENQVDLRIDAFLANSLELSRTKVASDIEQGAVFVNGKTINKSYRVNLKDEISYTPIEKKVIDPKDQVTDLKILFSDDDIVVLDKPFGVAVHPSPGWEGPTVTASLASLGHRIATSGVPERQGVVQRLDVGTSGVMVVAKSEFAYEALKDLFRTRNIKKIYHALVQGHPDPSRDRKSTRLNSSHSQQSRMPSSA